MSILGNKLLTLMWIKWGHIELKALHLLWGVASDYYEDDLDLTIWGGPGFKLLSPESNLK